jgi:hypothetical protein
MSDAPASQPRSGPLRNWRRITRAVPLLVWCGSIVAVVLLYPQSRLKSAIRGVVDTQHHVVRAPMAGRLVALTVDLHEPVRAGQVIGRLGDEDLTAPCNGKVASLACAAGHWLQPGDTVLTVTEPAARRILAYVPESLRDHVAHNPLVHVFRPDRPGSRRTTSVRSISPALVPVPRRLLRDPRLEEWAWEVVLDAAGDEAPGESIQLLLTP